MRINDLFNVSLSYIVTVALVNLPLTAVGYGKPGIALAAGVVVGTNVAAWLYRRNRQGRASVRLRLFLGLLMALLCLVESVAFQVWLRWMTYPVATTVVAAGGTLIFPLVMFEGFRRRVASGRRR